MTIAELVRARRCPPPTLVFGLPQFLRPHEVQCAHCLSLSLDVSAP